MKSVKFSSVSVNSWFKESLDGCWHLKTGSCSGMYQRFGTRYEPRFFADEAVFVEGETKMSGENRRMDLTTVARLRGLMMDSITGRRLSQDDQSFVSDCYSRFPDQYGEVHKEVKGDAVRRINPFAA